jgi:hypothetical protein
MWMSQDRDTCAIPAVYTVHADTAKGKTEAHFEITVSTTGWSTTGFYDADKKGYTKFICYKVGDKKEERPCDYSDDLTKLNEYLGYVSGVDTKDVKKYVSAPSVPRFAKKS